MISFILTGCSNSSIYNGIQASNQFECSKLPPSQYDECMQTTDKSYDEYERERKEALAQ
jgi:hypothetical protein